MGRALNHTKLREQTKARRGLAAALVKPLGKRSKTIFGPPGKTTGSNLRKRGNDALAEHKRLQRNLKLAAHIGGRDADVEIIEHIPVERVYVSPRLAAIARARSRSGKFLNTEAAPF
jgi:hypothetical protein